MAKGAPTPESNNAINCGYIISIIEKIMDQGLYSLSGWTFYRKISKPRDSGLDFPNGCEIWKGPRQPCCRDACEIAELYNHYDIQSRGHETSRGLMTSEPSGNGASVFLHTLPSLQWRRMSVMVSQLTSHSTVCLSAHSVQHQRRKEQSSTLRSLCERIHQWIPLPKGH